MQSQISELAIYLKLPYIKEHSKQLLEEALHMQMDCEAFLLHLLEQEAYLRRENGIVKKLQSARFPVKKYLEDFDRSKYAPEFLPKFRELETLEFIEHKENIILIGTPGSGKTHYATSLGIKACIQGKSVLFTSVPNLVIELKEARTSNQLTSYKRKFERYDLVILDELGYVSFDKASCDLIFNLLSNRNDKGSVIITTNLTFDRWEEIFKDPMLTGAIVDRLAHKAHILDISRESQRLEDTINWLKEKAV